ncbi:MAG TPA: RNA polymerase sigma factor RpoD/SigA, partial [Candidatus Polarisedimenticolia bacterium]|nr:RNA polymerase sigma factor RpoD/SigA [Candidatus Polarisedimenticolia bacterium]
MPTVSSHGSSSVSLYLQEISAYSLLTKKQELAIARRIPEEKRSGRNDAAFHHLVRSHLGFVVKVAREYRNMGLSFEDLLGEGNLGLIEAANHFDPGRGTRFITYAVWWIRKSILRALSRQGATVRVPSYQLKKVRQVREAGRRLTHALGREADREEISRELRTDLETIDEILQVNLRKLSLEDRIGGATDAPISSHLVDRSTADPEAELIKNDTRRRIRVALGSLNDRDLTVIVNRFGLGGGRMFTLREIGGKMGIS